MMAIVYTFLLRCADILLPVIGIFSKKIATWLQLRRGTLPSLTDFRKKYPDEKIVWIHCSSHGEYEQVVPIIRMIKQKQDNVRVAVTFFSPSGYQHCDDYGLLDWKGMIPLDLPHRMRSFIHTMKPSKVIIVKNELWWNLLHQLIRDNIEYHLVYFGFRQNQYFIKRPTQWFKSVFQNATSISVTTERSKQLLYSKYYTPSHLIRDGKYIQAMDTAKSTWSNDFFEHLRKRKRPIIIYGSIWKEDYEATLSTINNNKNYIHVLFPHDLSDHNINQLSSPLEAPEVVTDLSDANTTKDIYIMKIMGILKHSYRYANMVYVGGGFGKGVHNVLEASAYGIAVAAGPKHSKSYENEELIERKYLTIVNKNTDFEQFLNQPRVLPAWKITQDEIHTQYRVLWEI